eukprot:687184-Alexandrium_andersonii.AAC.1
MALRMRRVVSALVALAPMKPPRADVPAPATAAADPRSAAQVAKVAAHRMPALLALLRPAAPLVRTAAATAALPARGVALALPAWTPTHPGPRR